jgi:hypothetical protein
MRKEDPKAPLVGILSGESPALPMMYKATIPTWDLLRCLGFQSDSNKSLLPWVRSMAEYNARPQCLVQRDWFRLALKGLRQQLSSLPDQEAIAFSFDGSVLFIRCCDKVIALPGEGVSWAVGFRVAAEKLRRLPKRFRHEQVDVSIWQSRISLGTWTYEGTVEQSGITHSSSVQ